MFINSCQNKCVILLSRFYCNWQMHDKTFVGENGFPTSAVGYFMVTLHSFRHAFYSQTSNVLPVKM